MAGRFLLYFMVLAGVVDIVLSDSYQLNSIQLTRKVRKLEKKWRATDRALKPKSNIIYLDNGYALAFRATAGIGQGVYEAYTNTGYNDDDPLVKAGMPCGCTGIDGTQYCDRHYRSKLLDAKLGALIDKIRFSLYTEGVEVAFVEFNGNNATSQNWFSGERLLTSSWLNLENGPWNFFSILGDKNRRFFINAVCNGCNNDLGWAVILDKPDVCEWGAFQPSYPAFLYSSLANHTLWQDKACVAPVITNAAHEYSYIWGNESMIPLALGHALVFSVKACNDAHILLASEPQGDFLGTDPSQYEIVIGGWNNGRSAIRTTQQQDPPRVTVNHSPLSCKQFRRFYISWHGDKVKVGAVTSFGRPEPPFMTYDNPSPFTVRYAYASGYDTPSEWRFETPCEMAGVGHADVMTVSVKFLNSTDLDRSCTPSDEF